MVGPQRQFQRQAPHNDGRAPDPHSWFADLLREMQKSLYARARLFSGKDEDAWDAVQITFERAWRRFSPQVPRCHARAWILRIHENGLISRWRASRRACRHLLPGDVDLPAPPPVDEPAYLALGRQDIAAAAERLPAPLRDVYQLCEFEGMSYDEASAQLGVARATVGTRLYRARQRLRVILSAQLGAQT
jgi:RNA polymerase sigma-70 factor, ECF subfamily